MAELTLELKLPNGSLLRLSHDEARSIYDSLGQLLGNKREQAQAYAPVHQQVTYRQLADGQVVQVSYPAIGGAIPLGFDRDR
jgi:hypothetical protein